MPEPGGRRRDRLSRNSCPAAKIGDSKDFPKGFNFDLEVTKSIELSCEDIDATTGAGTAVNETAPEIRASEWLLAGALLAEFLPALIDLGARMRRFAPARA